MNFVWARLRIVPAPGLDFRGLALRLRLRLGLGFRVMNIDDL